MDPPDAVVVVPAREQGRIDLVEFEIWVAGPWGAALAVRSMLCPTPRTRF